MSLRTLTFRHDDSTDHVGVRFAHPNLRALEYLKITMTDVIVSGVSLLRGGGNERIREVASLSFSRVTYEYVVQNAQGGSGGTVTAGFDIKGNKEV
jgi:type VI protein secretion system component Hcp